MPYELLKSPFWLAKTAKIPWTSHVGWDVSSPWTKNSVANGPKNATPLSPCFHHWPQGRPPVQGSWRVLLLQRARPTGRWDLALEAMDQPSSGRKELVLMSKRWVYYWFHSSIFGYLWATKMGFYFYLKISTKECCIIFFGGMVDECWAADGDFRPPTGPTA